MSEINEPLSERELEILRLVATGAANKEIARQLVISPNTVKVHLRNIFAKTGVASRTEATLYAVHIGLVRPNTSQAAVPESGVPEPFADTSAGSTGYEVTGLPGIVLEEEPFARGAETPGQARLGRTPWKAWQIGLVAVILALVLVGSGMAGARLLGAPTVSPATTARAATPVVTVKRWSEMPVLPGARKGMGIVEYENAIYLLGGETSGGLDGAVLRYEPSGSAWKALASKPTPVTEIQAALLGEKIYVPGGLLADGSATAKLEVYDPRQDRWESLAPLPVAISGYSLAAFEGQLYLFGGKSGDRYLSTVYGYDPQENRWSERSPLDAPRAFAGAAVVDGKIFLTGGYDGRHALDLNQAYMPTRDGHGENPWETYAPLPHSRYAMGTTALASIIYVLGGLDEQNQPVKNGALQYNVKDNQWVAFDDPPQGVGRLPALLASGNFLYILGGETTGGLSAANQAYQAIYTIAVPILRSDGEP